MRKSIKCGIVAAVVVAAGFASYQSYGVYSIQNNSLLMQNVEALATGTESNPKKLPAHKCNRFGDENPGFDAFSKQRAYICSNGHETTKEKAYNQQIKCSYYGFKRWGGAGEDNKHWCVF